MKSLDFWTVDKFEISSHQYKLSERVNKSYNGSGTDQTGLCKYSYNELGYRGDSIYKDGFKIMSIGCSVTEGVGVNDNETWSFSFCDMVDGGVDINMACGGRSNDYISRCLLTYYDLIKPDLVLIMYSESHRRDFFTEDGGVEPFHVKDWGYFSEIDKGKDEHNALLTLSNKENNFQNWLKNHLLIKYFLESKKCNWLWNGWFATDDYSDELRFDGDFHPFIDYGVDGSHPGPLTHKKYSKKLFDYITTNFPNYLP